MGSGRAATTRMPRINSETNFAVQLLLAVSDSRVTKSDQGTHSATSSDARLDTSSDSDATEATASAVASPTVQHKSAPTNSSPRAVGSALTRADATFFKYTREERLEALQRFREKKRRRQFQKRVRYMVRKRLAETRPRYKGRFSKPPPGENYDDGTPGSPPHITDKSASNRSRPVVKE